MQTFRLVMPEHLNHYGYLFGGNLLKWVDEVAYIAANLDYPGRRFVTVAFKDVEFRRDVQSGTILCFNIEQARIGRTSVSYHVSVQRDCIETGQAVTVFDTTVTFVNIDEDGHKKKLL